MALLGTIRNQFGWLMMGMVVVGIGSFLLMDVSGPKGTPTGPAHAAKINGEKISRQEWQNYVENVRKNSRRPMSTAEAEAQAWSKLKSDYILMQRSKQAGFSVSSKEMGALFVGEDGMISPLVVQTYGQNGRVDKEAMKQAIQYFKRFNPANMNEQQKASYPKDKANWDQFSETVKVDRMRSKYLGLVAKGVFTPTWMVETLNTREKATYNFQYVHIPYAAITQEVTATDEEMKTYIQKHASEYEREAAAGIAYALFDVRATIADSAMYLTEMTEAAKSLNENKSYSEDSLVVIQYDGEFTEVFSTKEDLNAPDAIKDSLFNVDEKTVLGPYIHNGAYVVTKLQERKTLPDSVRSRQIQINVRTREEYTQGLALLDSLKGLVENGGSFDTLANQFSQDLTTKAKGGDLGFRGESTSINKVYEFYSGEKDSLKIIFTNEGSSISLVQITDYKFETDRKGVRVATVRQNIIPSDETVEMVENKVNDFVVANRDYESFKAAVDKGAIKNANSIGLEQGGFAINELGADARTASVSKIIRWAHNPSTELGSVGMLYPINDVQKNYIKQFIVPVLTSRTAKGLASLNDVSVKNEVKRKVENQKKAAAIKAELGTDLNAIASKYGVQVESASNVEYGTAKVGPSGKEPNVLGAVAALEANAVSKPVEGSTGVFVVKMLSKTDAISVQDVKTARETINAKLIGNLGSFIFRTMEREASIEDERNPY